MRLKVSEAERRQAKHDIRSVEDIVVELLRNSRDATFVASFLPPAREGDLRTLTVVDDGVGVPPQMADRIFEPRVTSKLDSMVVDQWGVHGRGMALFSIAATPSRPKSRASEPHKGTASRSSRTARSSPSAPTSPHGRSWSGTNEGVLESRARTAQHRPAYHGVRRRASGRRALHRHSD